jgi:putative membrane protein
MSRTFLISAAALAICTAPAFAQTHARANADHQFVMNAARGGMAEVELGKMATEKGTSDEVKKFGRRMADDHGKAGEKLKTLAQNKHITLPTDLDPKDKALRDRLMKLSGPAFDRAYMRAMVTDHVKDVSEFSRTSRTAKDEDVKSFAAKTLPTVQEHLRMARDGNRAVGTSGKK